MGRDQTDDHDDEKLIPDWEAEADDQIIWAGLAVFAALFLFLVGWNWIQGDDGPVTAAIDELTDEGDGGSANDGGDGDLAAPSVATDSDSATDGDSDSDTAEPATTTTAAPATTTTDAVTTTAAPTTVPSGPDLDALTGALAPEPGDVTAVVIGANVTLTGYLADRAEEEAVIEAVAAVELVESVTSELVLLEPAVAQVLGDQGVVVAIVDGVGTELTVSGTLQSEADREPTIAAAEGVAGVTAIVDELVVGVADDLNALPTIPFATASATILPEGQAIVAEAARIIGEGGPVSFEIQGYTDVIGDDQANLELSRARAVAVLDALVATGLDPELLTATGFGETNEFGAGTSPEALAANRVVRFVQTG